MLFLAYLCWECDAWTSGYVYVLMHACIFTPTSHYYLLFMIELVISRTDCYWFPCAWHYIIHVILLLNFHLRTIQCIGFPPCEKMKKGSQRLYSALMQCFFSVVFYLSISDLLFLSSCLFLPFVKKHSAYACPTTIWKQIISFEFTNSTLLWILLMAK